MPNHLLPWLALPACIAAQLACHDGSLETAADANTERPVNDATLPPGSTLSVNTDVGADVMLGLGDAGLASDSRGGAADASSAGSDRSNVDLGRSIPQASCTPGAPIANPPRTLFHIGHSLTDRMADVLNELVEIPLGQRVPFSYKSIPGATLLHHRQNLADGRKGNIREGTPIEILRSGAVDTLILTESTGIESHLNHHTRSSKNHANFFVDEFLSATRHVRPLVLIYSTWERRRVPESSNPSDPQAQWIGWEDTPTTIAHFISETERRQTVWEELAEAVQLAHPQIPVRIVPGGLVLVELQKRVLEARLTLPGSLSFRETFFKRNRPGRYGGCAVRDHIHLSQIGTYVIALAHYMTIYGNCPSEGFVNQVPMSGLNECGEANTIELDATFAAQLRDIVWQVVSAYAWSGIAQPRL